MQLWLVFDAVCTCGKGFASLNYLVTTFYADVDVEN